MAEANKDLREVNMDFIVRHKNDYLFGTPAPCERPIVDNTIRIMSSTNMNLIMNKLRRGMFIVPYKDLSYVEAEFILMNSNSYLNSDEKCIVVRPYNNKTN